MYIYIYMHIYTTLCIHIYMCIYIYIYIYTHTHAHTFFGEVILVWLLHGWMAGLIVKHCSAAAVAGRRMTSTTIFY